LEAEGLDSFEAFDFENEGLDDFSVETFDFRDLSLDEGLCEDELLLDGELEGLDREELGRLEEDREVDDLEELGQVCRIITRPGDRSALMTVWVIPIPIPEFITSCPAVAPSSAQRKSLAQ